MCNNVKIEVFRGVFHIFAYNFLQTQPILICYSSLSSPKNMLKHSTNLIKIIFVFKKLLSINQLTAQLFGSRTEYPRNFFEK
jgi:hypothetical protein